MNLLSETYNNLFLLHNIAQDINNILLLFTNKKISPA